MVHIFRKTKAHTTPIRQREVSEHQIIQSKYPTVGRGPQEESHPFRNLNFPNPLPRETRERSTPDLIIKRPNIELTIPIKTPMGTIAPNAFRNPRLDEI